MSDSSKIDLRDLFALKSDLLIAADLVRNKSVKGRLVEHAGLISRLIAERVSEKSTTQPAGGEPIAWMHEDELPEGYPYDAMFPFSKVDFVRMFPVFAPPVAAHGDEAVRKDAERIRQLEVLLDRCRDHVSESMELMDDYDDAEEDAGIAQELLDDIDAAMRAQAGDHD